MTLSRTERPTHGKPVAESLPELPPLEMIYGTTPAMAAVRTALERVAKLPVPVLIQGESGTGKALIAALLHAGSEGCQGPFIQVNCPALPANLVESELFGYEPGAFTGAGATKPGWVEMAEGGTLFLDEIGDFALELQAKLLQLLQDGHFARIGASEERQASARVVCATNRDLARDAESGRFRRDLYYRIATVSIALPPLRKRAEDIPGLADYFLRIYAVKFQRPQPPLSAEALRTMCGYSWPGNVRQLQNVAKRLVILGTEDVVFQEVASRCGEELEFDLDGDSSLSLKEITRGAVDKLERIVISRSLREHNWSRRRVSRSLKISYRALLYKIKKLELPPKRMPPRLPPPLSPLLSPIETQETPER